MHRLHKSAHSRLCLLHYPPLQFTLIQEGLDKLGFLGKVIDKPLISGLCLSQQAQSMAVEM